MQQESIKSRIEEAARKKFGIDTVKPFQLLVMHRILEQDNIKQIRHQIVILPTGTGKSLCFLLPATLINNITIIVYPLLALMNDQMKVLQKSDIDCVCLRGGQTETERKKIFQKLKNGTKIIITNPETLTQKPILRKLTEFKIGLLVVDEAHVIAQWGDDFRPAYLQLRETVKLLKPHQVIAFTATASNEAVQKISDCLTIQSPLIVRGDADRENICYNAYPAIDKTEGILEILKFCKKPAIVFCSTRLSTYRYCVFLKRFFPKIPMRYYHAGLTKSERERIELWFLNSNNGILFATCAYGMGIDKPNIRTAIHSYIPNSTEEYLQESGRIGRDRQNSEAFVIISQEDTGDIAEIFRGNKCRRIELLKTLGQEKENCTGCDICNDTTLSHPYGYKQIQKLINKHPFRYTASKAARLLTGTKCRYNITDKMLRSPFYNILSCDEDLLKDSISKMGFGELRTNNGEVLLYKKNDKVQNFFACLLQELLSKLHL